MICAEQNLSGQFVVAAVQQADLSQCAAVILQGSDLPSLQFLSQIPLAAEGAQVFAVGVATPIAFWGLGVAVRAVLSMIR